jgi:hypothetical protein
VGIRHELPTKADAGSTDAHVDAITAVVNFKTDSHDDQRASFKSGSRRCALRGRRDTSNR